MELYTPRHATPSRLVTAWQRFDKWADQPMTGAAALFCGALMGLFFGSLVFLCYFG